MIEDIKEGDFVVFNDPIHGEFSGVIRIIQNIEYKYGIKSGDGTAFFPEDQVVSVYTKALNPEYFL